jgi:Ca-activated chloride channel homolog
MGIAGEPVGEGAVSFDDPRLLWLAVVLPVLVGAGVLAWAARRRRAARALGAAHLLQRLGAGDLQRVQVGRLVLLCTAAAALGVALAGPRWGLESVEEESVAGDLVLALDVSRSMLARDIAPDRMERQRVLARRVLREMSGDRIGLVVFAGRAFALTPLTADHGALHLFLDTLDPDIVSQGGSSLSAAVRQATDLARGPHDAGRGTVLLVSDGEALEDRDTVLRAADRAASVGITIHTVGMGTRAGAPVPARPGPDGGVEGYTRGPDGEVVVSRLDEELLREIARRTGGRYVALGDPGSTDAILRNLQGLDRTEGDVRRGVRERPRYAWFAFLALALLAADGVLATDRWGRSAAAPANGLRAGRPLP